MPDEKPSIEQVTRELERGDAQHLPELLNSAFREDRIATLEKIQEQNRKDRAKDPNLPELRLDVQTYPTGLLTQFKLDRHGWRDSIVGPRVVYRDSLDMGYGAKPATLVSPAASRLDVRALTAQLEAGNGKGIGAQLNGTYEEERVNIFKQVQALNVENRQAGRTTAKLRVDISSRKSGHETTIAIDRWLPGTWDSVAGGPLIYKERFDWRARSRNVVTEALDARPR